MCAWCPVCIPISHPVFLVKALLPLETKSWKLKAAYPKAVLDFFVFIYCIITVCLVGQHYISTKCLWNTAEKSSFACFFFFLVKVSHVTCVLWCLLCVISNPWSPCYLSNLMTEYLINVKAEIKCDSLHAPSASDLCTSTWHDTDALIVVTHTQAQGRSRTGWLSPTMFKFVPGSAIEE